jgi:hypothetical protein
MLVVSDTSPISALMQIGHAELLRDLFGTVYMPSAVNDELSRFHTALPAYIEIREVVDRTRVEALLPRLDRGEAEAIVLAIETQADQLLIDERRGRSIAAQSGLRIIGLIGILLLAKDRGLISAIRKPLADLQTKAGFYTADSLIREALEAAGE